MLFNIGVVLTFVSIIFGFVMEGGNVGVLNQPYAAIMILGSAMGIFLISNPKPLLVSIWHDISKISIGFPYRKKDYLELLIFMFYVFRFAGSKSKMELEIQIENPSESTLFRDFPKILRNKEATTFLCDYMRLIVLGYENTYELENIMQEQIDVRSQHAIEIGGAFYRLGDTLPALGIVTAILGVVNAMGSIHMDPQVLGHKIGAALIGTFFGVAFAYCIAIPMGSYFEKFGMAELKYLECIKAGFMAHARGNPPSIAIEFARQAIPVNLKPSFAEIERELESYKKFIKNKVYV